ncbi:uncharacterized protein LOC119077206 [Bradysia coprophila]|uniref:uncharacterized protein LOC119077206 n=1 Tax=Bradysia coprophila TaxID=38358 RepID=UPI00187D6F6F|nr:uncharacterized protein LOC119077206 [Bradysia coprophila]
MVYYESGAWANDEEWNNNFLENSEIDFDTNVQPIQISQPRVSNVIIYPIFKDKTVMIVPKSKPYPEFLAYLQLFTSTNVFIYIIFTIALTIVLLTLIRHKDDKEANLFKSGSDILYLLMNENGFITYQMRSLSEICLLVPLTFAGFIFVNGFMSILQSYLIQPVMQPQINTLEDIYKSNIMIYPDLDDLQDMFRSLTTYKGRKEASNSYTYKSRLRGRFSGIFSESENFWKEKEQTEEKLGVRGFHISDVYLDESLYAYRVNDAFPFADRMNDIISRLQCAGLIERWTRFTAAAPFTGNVEDRDKLLREEVVFHYLSAPNLPYNEEPSDFPIFVIYGWGVSAIVFFMEILFHLLLSNFSRIRRGLAAGCSKRGIKSVKERIFHLFRKL